MPPKGTKRSTMAASQKPQAKSSAGNSKSAETASQTSQPSAQPVVAPQKSLSVTLQTVGKCIALVSGLTVASISFQEILHPLYGSIPTSLHYRKVALGSSMFSLLLGQLTALDERTALTGIASFLAAAPVTALWVGSWAAKLGSPVWGPVITQLFIAAPVWCFCSFLLSTWMVSSHVFMSQAFNLTRRDSHLFPHKSLKLQ